jgi:nucleoside-diphosphate-sugar epimerase
LKTLVTGGAGFIGSNLVRRLLARGDAVRVLDDFSTGKRENLEGLGGGLEVLDGDIRDLGTCRAACEGMEALLHQAALGSVPRSVKDPLTTNEVNVRGTLNLLVAARERGVRRFVFASSSSVYGDAPEPVKIETLPPRPVSPYGVSKLAAEAYCLAFFRVYGLETVALRYFNVFGPRQDPHSLYAAVVPRFASSILQRRPAVIYGDGEQSRDFTHVDNVVDANLLAAAARPEACGRCYNIACGAATSIKVLLRSLQAAAGATELAEPIHEPPRPGDVRNSLASIDAAREFLGYRPVIGIQKGLERTMAWYRTSAAGEELLGFERPTPEKEPVASPPGS